MLIDNSAGTDMRATSARQIAVVALASAAAGGLIARGIAIPDDAMWPLAGIAGFLAVVAIARLVGGLAQARLLLAYAQIRENQARERFERVLNSATEAISIIGRDGAIVFQNEAMTDLTGRYPWEVVGQPYATLFGPENQSRVGSGLAAAAINGTCRTAPIAFSGAIGERVVTLRARSHFGDRCIDGIVVTARDISDQMRARQDADRLRTEDDLTGLANRETFLRQVKIEIEAPDADRERLLAVIDLDGFGALNRERGFDVGNEVLRVIAHRLSVAAGAADLVGRLDGDRFALVVRCANPNRWLEVTIREIFARPVAVGICDLAVFGHCGYRVLAAGETGALATALAEAELALGQAKTMQSAVPVGFGMDMSAETWIPADHDITEAMASNALSLHYQPIVALNSCEVVEMEALLRWTHPVYGEISPDRLLPVAEAGDVIVPLTWWVLETACAQGTEWLRQRPHVPLTVSVNLSARMFNQPDLVDRLSLVLCAHGFPARLLRLEIVESVLAVDVPRARAVLASLKAIGVQLAIDDFGTGFSSLAYLQHFPVDVIKIDRTFVHGMTDSVQSAEIVRSIVDLARKLHIETTGEGIETVAQLKQLRELGSERGQGFLFSHPMAADDLDLTSARDYPAFAA